MTSRHSKRWAVGMAAVTALSALTMGLAGAAHAASSATPPYEPDASAVGTLTFYDASGKVVTSGSTLSTPFASYAVGSNTVRTGDSFSSLFLFTPVNGTLPANYSGDELNGYTQYPVTGAPAVVSGAKAADGSAAPVTTLTAQDSSLESIIEEYPNRDTSTTDGYAGLYQLRLRTATNDLGTGSTITYDDADIQVNSTNHTFTVVYPAPATPTSTSTALSVTPTSPAPNGSTETLKATVSPTGAAGTVQFFDGATAINSTPATVTNGVATATATLAQGSHSLTATFTPTDSTAYGSSTSPTVTYVVSAPAGPTTTTTALTVTPTSPAPNGSTETLKATVSPTGAAGTVQFFDGATAINSTPATVTNGVATATATLAQGSHSLTATFTPTDSTAYGSSTSPAQSYVVSAPAGPTTTTTALTVTPTSPAPNGSTETLKATVSPTGAAGTVQFFDGATAINSTPATVTNGVATATATLAQGSHSLTATFTPTNSSAFGSSTSPTVTYVVSAPATMTTTSLAVTPASPADANTRESLTATVTPSAAVGSVTFKDGTTTLGSAAVSGGTASLTTTLAPGSHSLTATFVPTNTAVYTGSTSTATPYTVNQPTSVGIIAVEGTNNSLYVSQDGAAFVSYGGVLTAAPQVVTTDTRDYYVVRGQNGDLFVRTNSTAFTHLRPSAPLVCASAPAAELSEDGQSLIVDCTGTTGYLYGIKAPLTATGNPVATTVTRSSVGNLPTTGTAAIGTYQDGEFGVVGGSSYAAQTGVHIAGNVYLVDGDPTSSTFGTHASIGGSCSGAPELASTDGDDYITCHSPTTAETLVYKFDDSAGTTTAIDLHGSAIASPGVLAADDGIVVLVTGTNGRPYYATVPDSGNATAFISGPVPGDAASGPSVAVGPPSSLSGSTRHGSSRW